MSSQPTGSNAFNVARVLLSIPAFLLGFIGLGAVAVGIRAVPVDPEPTDTKAELDRWLYWPNLVFGLPLLLVAVAGFLWAYGPGRRRQFSRIAGLVPSNLAMLALIIAGQLHAY